MPAEAGSDLLLEVSPQGYGVLSLNRPQASNALSMALRRALVTTLAQLEGDERVRVLIVTGAGRSFCAGLDLKELAAGGDSGAFSGSRDSDPVGALARFPRPVIGAINGAAITGGFELALACDILIGSPAARFIDTHVRMGVVPGWGLSQKLSRLLGIHRAKRVSFTGEPITADRAEAWGILSEVVPAEELLPAARRMAAAIAAADPAILQTYKRLIDEGYAKDFGAALDAEAALAKAANAKL